MPSPEQIQNLIAACTAAVASEKSTGCPAELTVPQWVVESRWGLNMPAGSNNPFGIKARPGDPFVAAMTTEYYHGTATQVSQNFHKYDSLADAFNAHGLLIATGRPYQEAFAAYETDHDPIKLIAGIAPHYATSPVYTSTLLQILAEPIVKQEIAVARVGVPVGTV